jgi:hypothetical protein
MELEIEGLGQQLVAAPRPLSSTRRTATGPSGA